MDLVISFFRDTLSGWPYAIMVIFCLFFIFAIIGYLCGEKYRGQWLKTKILLSNINKIWEKIYYFLFLYVIIFYESMVI